MHARAPNSSAQGMKEANVSDKWFYVTYKELLAYL
jgi:hypothetical protein